MVNTSSGLSGVRSQLLALQALPSLASQRSRTVVMSSLDPADNSEYHNNNENMNSSGVRHKNGALCREDIMSSADVSAQI